MYEIQNDCITGYSVNLRINEYGENLLGDTNFSLNDWIEPRGA